MRRCLAVVVVALVLPGTVRGDTATLSAAGAAAGLAEVRGRRAGMDPKLDSQLHALLALPALPVSRHFARSRPAWQEGSEVRVQVRVTSTRPAALAALGAAGLLVERVAASHGRVVGRIATGSLPALAAAAGVAGVRPALPGWVRTVEGDAAARANVARAASGVTGSGIAVGVISDGNDDHYPGSSTPGGCSAGSGYEGSAMLEIVDALAPGATLYFSEGISSSLGFIDSVDCLRAAGAKVIVDDIGFFDEPFFEDGPVATAVRSVVAAGVSYHTAAGNEGDIHYAATYDAAPSSTLHAFDGAGDTTNDVVVPSGGAVTCVLQWNDRWGQSGNDYDLAAYDGDGTLVATSVNVQAGSEDPFEFFGPIVNVGPGSATLRVVIDRVPGASSRMLKLFCLGAQSMEYRTTSESIIGHAAVGEAVTVAAIDVDDAGLDDVEAFSSQGPVPIYFPSAETRSKPDLAGFDGVTTGAPGFAPFFGTSAAAPHAAAVAALVLAKNDCLTPAEVQATLKAGAVDIEGSGFDGVAGAGRLDAKNAIDLVQAKNCTIAADCDDGDACTTDACSSCTCTHTAVSCDDGDACTADTCTALGGCAHATLADGTPCPDETVCNGAETCQGGNCTAGTPLTCTDGLVCTLDTCDAETGCEYPPDPCSDGNACTADTCDEGTGCQHAAVADGTSCADGEPCDGAEACQSGTCVDGPPPTCEDEDACSENTCESLVGCANPPVEGFPGLDCLCARGLGFDPCLTDDVPSAVTGRFDRACRLVGRAEAAATARGQRRLVKRAAALLAKAARRAERAESRARVSDACGSALASACWDAQGRAARLRDML